jgi:SNF2 family DNA or RNA helicase
VSCCWSCSQLLSLLYRISCVMRVILPFTGINLTAADTVIIYDSDFNPQNDLQAQARCHRIGQTKSVKVYRLLTRKSYEMQMFHMSSLKMGLDQAVLQGLESGNSKVGTVALCCKC